MKRQRVGLANWTTLFLVRLDHALDQKGCFTLETLRQVIPEETSKRRFYDLINVWEGLGVVRLKSSKPRVYKWFGPGKSKEHIIDLCAFGRTNLYLVPKHGYSKLPQLAHHMGVYMCEKARFPGVTIKMLQTKFKSPRRIYDVLAVMIALGFVKVFKQKRGKKRLAWVCSYETEDSLESPEWEMPVIPTVNYGINVFE